MALPALLFAASAGFNALGARNAAIAEKAALSGQARTIRKNAAFAVETARLNESEFGRVGKKAELKVRRDSRSLRGAQKAAFAGSGVDISFGTPLEIFGDTDFIGDDDVQTIRDDTRRKINRSNRAANFEIEGLNENARNLEASALNIDPNFAFLTSLLGSASQAGTKFQKSNNSPFTRLSGSDQRRLTNVPFKN